MSESLPELSWLVLRATCFLSVAAALALFALRRQSRWSPGTTAAVWTMVLLSGICVFPATVEVPWYELPTSSIDSESESITMTDVPRTAVVSGAIDQRPTTDNVYRSAPASRSWAAMLRTSCSTIWACGTAVIAILFLAGYAGLLIALRSTWRPQKIWQQEYDQVTGAVGIKSPPELLVHTHLGPLLCMTPRGHRLVVPCDQWSQLTVAERHVVLRHELGHYVRKDVWWTLPVRFVVLLHWFNPLAWLAARRVEETAECAADKYALQNDPSGPGDLASALLKLALQPSPSRLFASPAHGRSLTRRLKSLIHHTEPSGAEPMFRKLSVIALMACVLIAGAIQIRLVAQEAEAEPEASGASRITIETATEFAGKLAGGDDLAETLKSALQSEPGALVLRDRAGHYEEMARREAQVDAIPKLFDELFEPSGDQLKLRSGQEQFRKDLLASAEVFNSDVDTMLAAMKETAAKMEVETDTDKLLHRFLNHDGAPVILYVKELRPRLRPGLQVLERVFQDVFALRSDGRYVIRLDARPKAEQMVAKFDERNKLLDVVKRDVAELSEDIAAVDDFHVTVKKALNDPVFVTRISMDLFESKQVNRGMAAKMLEELEGAFREAGDGLVARDEPRSEIEEILQKMEQIKRVMNVIRKPLREFADKVADDDEIHRAWATMLRTDVAVIRVAGQIEYATADVGDAVQEFLGQVLAEKENGRLHVEPAEFSEEQLIDGITEMFQQYRAARRRGREADEYSAKINDQELSTSLQSTGGKLALGEILRSRYMKNVPDGFQQWVSEHFSETSEGYVIREEVREEIEEVVRQIAEVKQELKNADF